MPPVLRCTSCAETWHNSIRLKECGHPEAGVDPCFRFNRTWRAGIFTELGGIAAHDRSGEP